MEHFVKGVEIIKDQVRVICNCDWKSIPQYTTDKSEFSAEERARMEHQAHYDEVIKKEQ